MKFVSIITIEQCNYLRLIAAEYQRFGNIVFERDALLVDEGKE